MPMRAITQMDKKIRTDQDLVEKWPIIQAYGLDLVAGGFFTMKH